MIHITRKAKTAVPSEQESEAVLMRCIAGKDRQAFERLYYDYSPRLGNFLMRLLKRPELVDEVINEVMMTVWQNAGRFDSAQGKLSTWLFGIAHNKALKALERGRRHLFEQVLETEEAGFTEDEWDDANAGLGSPDPDNPERTVLGWELGDILLWALDQLTPEHRIVVELTMTEQCTYQDIALITGCPVNTVKTRMFNARKKLAELLIKRGYSPYDIEEAR